MDNVNLTIAICNIGCGLLVGGLSVPLIKGMVKMNNWYGIRLFKSFESEEHWYKMNKKGGKILFAWSVVILLSGILCPFLPKLEGPLFWALLLAPLLYVVAAIQCSLYSAKL